MDTSTPRISRYSWPKIFPALDAEQQTISDDFMRRWHEVLPRRYGLGEQFNQTYPLRVLPSAARWRTMELGAGLGAHLEFEDLSRQDYFCIEMRENMAEAIRAKHPHVNTVVGDCQERLPFDDASFDRVIAVHVLEHLPRLPDAIEQVWRVLKPGGLFALVIPCDPGAVYEMARKISAERLFKKIYGIPYGWLIRREHINSPDEILSLVRPRFEIIDQAHFPLLVPVAWLNLCIGVTARKPAT